MSTTSEPSNFNLKIANKRSGRLRNGKIYRNVNNKLGSKRSGKVKFEHTNSQNCSENVSRSFESFSGKNAKKDKVYPCVEQKEVMVDVKKLEELIEAAVEATAKAQVNTMVRLYEELEIVSLRYSSKVDRTHLPEVPYDVLPFVFYLLLHFYSLHFHLRNWQEKFRYSI